MVDPKKANMSRAKEPKHSKDNNFVSGQYLNRELSLLDFHARVLELARDDQNPLLERLKFLYISSTNLDEFFEIRVAALKQKHVAQVSAAGSDGLTPGELLRRISEKAHYIVKEQYRVLNEELIRDLNVEGIEILQKSQWTEEQKKWVSSYFRSHVLPVLSPLGLDPAHPFPRILNKSLNIVVDLAGKDAFGRDIHIAIVPAPRSLPRLIRIPEEFATQKHQFVTLAGIMQSHMQHLFPEMRVSGCYQFRVTRNSNLFVDEEEIDDLLISLEGELPSRRYGDAVRLEVEECCPEGIYQYLLRQFSLKDEDLYRVDGPVNLNRLSAIYDLVQCPELKYARFTPGIARQFLPGSDVFAAIRRGDILMHHPFESFAPVLDFLRQAAHDPDVMVVKQTLYRTGVDSVIVDYLVEAAQSGKEVTVVVELRARFDEEANIALATRLQEAGAHVVYGIVGYKTHSKMLMVVRREGDKLKRYVHLGTGNYHPQTTRLYTDYGLFTCDQRVGEDIHNVFLQLTGLGRVKKLQKLLQSPFTLEKGLLEAIKREMAHCKAGRKACIKAKMNALTEPKMIQALYDASGAGVKIDLIVRGICCLKPGQKGLSENITVRSVLGRFLEHARVYYFYNDGKEDVLLASADLMTRNLSRRVEIAFPIANKVLKQRVIEEAFDAYFADTQGTWILMSDGRYKKVVSKGGKTVSAQQKLLLKLAQHP